MGRRDSSGPGGPIVTRRAAALAALTGCTPWVRAQDAGSMPGPATRRLAMAWRTADRNGSSVDRVGVVEIDWDGGRVHLRGERAVATRAHGLLALPDGGFVAVAQRPGRWLMRCDDRGRCLVELQVDQELPGRTLNGHVELSSGGAWLYSTETDTASQVGWISVRDVRTLARVAQFESGGIEPHQLLRDTDGAVVVANGGIVRDAEGRKVAAERMAPSLVRLHGDSGDVLGRWRLADPRLSLRHLAWARMDAGNGSVRLLGVALQAEHERTADRREAPAFALWDGTALTVPSRDAAAGGYVGDIAPAADGGFVLSAQKAGRGLWWSPRQPDRLTRVAELTEPCAMAADGDRAALISAERGAARWHPHEAGRMVRWPASWVPDNHWVLLDRV